MIIERNGRIWADTPGVQAAVAKFHGRHLGHGDFVVAVGDQDIHFERMDGTEVGDAIAKEYNFTGRPHRVEGNARAIDTVIKEIPE